jgi:hypothetical protein
MVARGLKGIREPCKDGLVVVMDHRGLAVHEVQCANHISTEGLADRLVAEADAEDRHPAGEVLDHLDRYPPHG